MFTFEQNVTAGPNPLVHVNPNKMYTKPIEYEYKTYGRLKNKVEKNAIKPKAENEGFSIYSSINLLN